MQQICTTEQKTGYIQELRNALSIDKDCISAYQLPFSHNDTTAGAENELQTVVIGQKEDVDLPQQILNSNYYKNLRRRVNVGDASPKLLDEINRHLDNCSGVWDNSWLRLPFDSLKPLTRNEFEHDLKADKTVEDSPRRADSDKFFIELQEKQFIRVPVSYVLKLSLIQALSDESLPQSMRTLFKKYTKAFVCDNTSPEVLTFSPVTGNCGETLANETAIRLYLCQLLLLYASKTFKLEEHGQKPLIYMAPHVPVRQQQLNRLIPDSFYRDLFINPCLSGWSKGEEKYQYMRLCHKVLSRSHLNAVAKLKDANILTNNLVILPNTSNASLATNGTHISIGSKKLTTAMKSGKISEATEKYSGDLVSKIMEHFLPLFAVNYTAAPYRLHFRDFHPEKALGFLSHELDYTHLRMLWRRWKKKAKLNAFGYRLTPFGPVWLDNLVSKVLGLSGDYIPDFRLIDYFMTVLSTDESPALNGELGNNKALKKDLTAMGIFDEKMSIYTLFRARSCKTHGFCGFEGRFYSLFPDLNNELSSAINLQNLLTSLCYKYILSGEITHDCIPDTPAVESERRQIFFDTAVGIPTFYIKTKTKNKLLHKILTHCKKTRKSSRYSGYTRIKIKEYKRGLIRMIKADAADLIKNLKAKPLVEDLKTRVTNKHKSASRKLTDQITKSCGKKSALKVNAEKFNLAAETYYREQLRKNHLSEGVEAISKLLIQLDYNNDAPELSQALKSVRKVNLKNVLNPEAMTEKELLQAVQTSLCAINYHEIKNCL